MDKKRYELRTAVRGAYDLQKLRIQMGNRIVGNFKVKLGQEPGEKESEIDKEAEKILSSLRSSFAKLTDGVVTFPREATFKGDGVIDSWAELALVEAYVNQARVEKTAFNRIDKMLEKHQIWTEYLQDTKGICSGVGPAMGGVLISEINIAKAQYPSSLWKYAGLDVAQDGQGRSRRKEHLVERDYVDKEGNDAVRNGITFNPFLKTKLMGVLASSFIKRQGPVYAPIYYDYKTRLENHPKHAEKTKGHRHNMAMRYMIKRFLADLYVKWRTMEGLPVGVEYSEDKLGRKHRKDDGDDIGSPV